MAHIIQLPNFGGDDRVFIDQREIAAIGPAQKRDRQDDPSRVIYLKGGAEIRVPEGPELRLLITCFQSL